MRFFVLVILLFVTLKLKGQDAIFYVPEDNMFSVLIDREANISSKKVENGLINYFVVSDSNGIFQYYFSVSRIHLGEDVNLYTENYIDAFKKECGCEVSSFNKASYNNLDGFKISIKANKQGRLLEGYSVSTAYNKVLYNITFLTQSESISIYSSRFDRFIDSFIINRSF